MGSGGGHDGADFPRGPWHTVRRHGWGAGDAMSRVVRLHPQPTSPATLPDAFLTLREVAALLRVSPKTLRNSMCLGGGGYQDLPRVKVGQQWLIPKQELATWLAARRVNGLPVRKGVRHA